MSIARRTATYLAAALCLAAAPLAASVTEVLERSLELGEQRAVVVNNINGPIEITATDADRLALRAVKTASNAAELEAIEVRIEEASGRIEIDVRINNSKRRWFDCCDSGSVAFELAVPRAAEVQARSVNGEVRIRAMQGAVRAKTVNGPVDIADVGGPVATETVNGEVKVAYAAVGDEQVHTFKAVNGSLQVLLPSEVSGSFRADTVNGSIDTDFPLKLEQSKGRRSKRIRAQLGESGAMFSFRTVNGSIEILKR